MMWGYGFGWGWFMMAFGGILWIAILAILVWALIRWWERKARVSGPSGSASPTATFEQMRERLQATERVPEANQGMRESSQRNF
jgi:uncharacterized membrane protein